MCSAFVFENFIRCVLLFAVIVPGWHSQEAGTLDQVDQVSLAIRLSENEIDGLRKDGMLKAKVPSNMVNRVAAVKFRSSQTMLPEARQLKTNVEKVGENLLVDIDESVIDRLELQPIEIPVQPSGFTNLVIRYKPNVELIPTPEDAQTEAETDSGFIVIRFKNKKSTIAQVRSFQELKIDSDLGKISLPVEKLLGVKFQSETENGVFVILENGDSISGKVDLASITLKTRWGDQAVKLKDLDYITNAVNVRMVPDQRKGKWKLVVDAVADEAESKSETDR